MKKVIRDGCFETNSSSMHSVTVRGKYEYNNDRVPMTIDDDGYIGVWTDEYGWYGDSCDTWYTKLGYAFCMVLITEYPDDVIYDNNAVVDQEVLEKLQGYQTLLAALKEHNSSCKGIYIYRDKGSFYPYGYIDHQSCEDYSSLQEFLDDWNVDAERYLFDDNVVVMIDNDNH